MWHASSLGGRALVGHSLTKIDTGVCRKGVQGQVNQARAQHRE